MNFQYLLWAELYSRGLSLYYEYSVSTIMGALKRPKGVVEGSRTVSARAPHENTAGS